MSTRRTEAATAGDGKGTPTTRELVLSASTSLFAERGFAATTMRQLADHAGLPLSAFYYYFRSKYDVLLALMDTAMRNLEAGLLEEADPTREPGDRLRALVSRHVVVHLVNPDIARVADNELRSLNDEDRAAIVERRDQYERHFRDALQAGVQDGTFDPGLDIAVASMAILTMATSVIDWWRPEGRHSLEETAELLGRFALAMVS